MAEAEEVSRAGEEIAAGVRSRMHALRAGKEEPCTAVPGPDGAGREGSRERDDAAAKAPPSCAPSCDTCPQIDSCGTRAAVTSGAARLSPDAVKTSADIAPYI